MLILSLGMTQAFGQSPLLGDSRTKPDGAQDLARRLYAQVLAHPSVGIPYGAGLTMYRPYLSKALLHRMDVARACGNDWFRQYPDPNVKPPLPWLELGTFTGGDDEEEFHAFHIEKSNSQNDGSIHVDLTLTWGTPPEKPWFSSVAPSGPTRKRPHSCGRRDLSQDPRGRRRLAAKASLILRMQRATLGRAPRGQVESVKTSIAPAQLKSHERQISESPHPACP
jgi:hypothetical protein